MKSPRYWTVILLLVVTAGLLYSRGDTDRVPYSEPLSMMPKTIGVRTSYDVPMDLSLIHI